MSAPLRGPVLAVLAFGWAGAADAADCASPSECRLSAAALLEAEDFEGAYARVKSALAQAPYDRETLSLRLRIEALAGSRMARWVALAAAERRLQEAGLPDDRRVDILHETARLRLQLGDGIGAEQDCLNALRLEPADAVASLHLAEALRDRPELALPHADRAALNAKTSRMKARAHRLAGEIRLDLGSLKAARRSLERALEVDGGDLETLRAMVRVLAAKPAQARAFAQRAARAAAAAPQWARAASLRFCAHVWLELKEFDEAAATLLLALESDPDDLESLETFVRIKNERPQSLAKARGAEAPGAPAAAAAEPPLLESSEAAARFADEIEALPSWLHADAYRLLARTWLALGDKRKAYKNIRCAEEAEIGSVRTARILLEIAPGGEDAARDLREAQLSVAQARDELRTR